MAAFTRLRPYLAIGLALAALLVLAGPVIAQDGGPPDYRQYFSLDSRLVVWVVAQLHLLFAAFVLGVPIFASVTEYVGYRTGEKRYDKLAHDFTKLLAASFSTTASFGGLLAFSLFALYPSFMSHLSDIFSPTYAWYGLLFFAEAFTMYFYLYAWDRLTGDKKKWHLWTGVLLNVFGVMIMLIANSWVTYMMSPPLAEVSAETGEVVGRGLNPLTLEWTGTLWQAINNPLWTPLNIHRFIGNVAFGGFVVGAYAAVRFLNAKTAEARAYFDWMGYIGNFIGVAALIPMPFAGYYMGREVYSYSAVMGNNMMGGAFSWTFILQAILIGALFIGANFYLWSGMSRIPGAERYGKYIKWLDVILIICFAIWLTPHNLPLSPTEQAEIGGQFHPTLKFLGLMAAKNAVINFIIIATYLSFLLYRRGNKGARAPFSRQGAGSRVVLLVGFGIVALVLGGYAYSLFTLDPGALDLDAAKRVYFLLPAILLTAEVVAGAVAVGLTFANRGVAGQVVYLAVTVINSVFLLGPYGFVVMTQANPFLRNIAVAQWLITMSALVFVTALDIVLLRGAEEIGAIRWGLMTERSQYALILLVVGAVMLMSLMGFIRSGLREDWHVFGALRDTSESAATPTMAYMARVIAAIVAAFIALVAFVFWLAGLGEKGDVEEGTMTPVAAPTPAPAARGAAGGAPGD
ncbi:MAG TPA: cytochrome ubiquinol oxidase subunit I [Anaerolineales bacterium]|nr:cytochrome ubiquinol oxidase subunit I [Anaerolineales bacterium]